MSDLMLRANEGEAATERGSTDLDRPPSAWRMVTDPSSHFPTVMGVVVIVAGFTLMFIAWGNVAGLRDVWRQFPYLMSAAVPGLALVMVGLVLINVASRRQDGARRAQQMAVLTEALRDLKRSIPK